MRSILVTKFGVHDYFISVKSAKIGVYIFDQSEIGFQVSREVKNEDVCKKSACKLIPTSRTVQIKIFDFSTW